MGQSEIPAGIIRAEAEKNRKSGLLGGWVMLGIWAFIYLFPFDAHTKAGARKRPGLCRSEPCGPLAVLP